MSDPRVPARVRRVLNVESGLNDGIATPIVLVAIAGVAAEEGIEGVDGPERAVIALLVGALVGVVTGAAGGVLTLVGPADGAGCRRNSLVRPCWRWRCCSLHRGAARGRQRLRRRVRRWAGVRLHRRARWEKESISSNSPATWCRWSRG